MSMSETIMVALVSAGSVLFGVIVGTVLPWVREWWINRRNARYLAVRVICILDKFAENCAQAIGQENQDDDLPVSPWPETLDFPADLDWRSLDRGLLYDILSLPNEVATAWNEVDAISLVASTEHDPQHLATVTQYYTPLGLKATVLAQKLRKTYSIPERKFDGINPGNHLKAEMANISP